MDSIEKRILNLRNKLSKLEYLYYFDGTSKITDEEYDKLLLELSSLETVRPDLITNESPTQRVGGFIKNVLNKKIHSSPMLSLKSIFRECELISFNDNLKKKLNIDKNIIYCCEPKFDGVAISIIYKRGKLVQAISRGDGISGEDMTKNVYDMVNIPIVLNNTNNLPSTLEVRGEIFMTHKNFYELNNFTEKYNKKMFSNPRNATAGLLRKVNNKYNKILNFYCYGDNGILLKFNNYLSDSHFERLKQYKIWGLPISNYNKIVINIEDIFNYHKEMQSLRSKIGYDIDGIVVKIDSLKERQKIEYKSSINKYIWAIAYKFPSKEKLTKVIDVKFQVGRTGLITPIAILEPVFISGVLISKSTLHNFKEIKRLNLMIGDTVLLSRSGDVIPKIVSIFLKNRPFNAKNIVIPNYCPSCSSELLLSSDLSKLYCNNGTTCHAQLKLTIKHFISRKAMNIKGIGEKVIQKLIDMNFLKKLDDLFNIKLDDLKKIDFIGDKLSRKIIFSLNLSKQTNLSRFLYSLGIKDVGETTAFNLANKYKTLEKIIDADIDSLINTNNIGKSVALNIYKFFRKQENISIIKSLLSSKVGIKINR